MCRALDLAGKEWVGAGSWADRGEWMCNGRWDLRVETELFGVVVMGDLLGLVRNVSRDHCAGTPEEEGWKVYILKGC